MSIVPYKHKAQYYETDKMGIIHHSNYIRWFEECRVDYLEQIGFPYHQIEANGISFPVLGISCQYKSKVHFGDTVQITCGFASLTKTRMSFYYRIIDEKSGELRTSGESQHCFIRNRDNRPVQLDKALPELYALFCSLKDQQNQI